MAELNETIIEVNNDNVDQLEEQDVKMESEDIADHKVPPCDICGKGFEKKGQKSLHMKKLHNIKTMQYTPMPISRKVGRPASRFICEICKEKKKTESELRNHMTMVHGFTCQTCKEKKKTETELRNHMTIVHGRTKRGLADMRQGQVQRAASVALSPPKKKMNLTKTTKNEESENKDNIIKSLELKNKTLVDATDKKQDQLNKQANIIGDLRMKINLLEIETDEKDIEIKRISEINHNLVNDLVSKNDTIQTLEEKMIKSQDAQKSNKSSHLVDASSTTQDEAMDKGQDQIATMNANKNTGYNREGPQMGARPKELHIKKGSPTQVKFDCTECTETRNSDEALASHIRCHEETGENKCDDCTYQSNDRGHLRNHLKRTRHTGTQKEYLCHECRLEFKSEEEEMNHMENHEVDGATALQADNPNVEPQGAQFECPICGHNAKSKSKIEKHMSCHDNDEEDSSFLCGDCSFQSMNRDQLLEHLETKHENHICNTCNIGCTSKNALNKHIAENHKSHKPCRDYATNSCDYESQCKYRHIRLKENEQICYTCGERTKALKDLMTHIKDTHGSQPCTRFAK